MGYLFLLLAVLAGSTKGYCGKRISGFVSDFGDSALSNCLRMMLCILIGAVAALAEGGFAGLATNPTTLLIALLAGASTAGNVLLWVLAAKNAPYIMLEVFLFLGAIVATVCCSVFFHEPITLFQWVGFALILAATATMSAKKSTSKEKISLKAFLLLIGSGLTYGMSEFSSKLFVYRGSGLTSAGFNFYTYLFGAAVLFVAALVLNLRREQPVQRAKTLIKSVRWYLVVMAICLFANSYFKVLAAGSLDASVMYPLAQGGSLILSVVMSAFLFRERITKQSILGVILAFLGSMALNL